MYKRYSNARVQKQILARKEKRDYRVFKSDKLPTKKKSKKEWVTLTADTETYTGSEYYTYVWSLAWYDGIQSFVSADEKDMHTEILASGYYMKHFDNFLIYLLTNYDASKYFIKVYFHNLKFDFEFFRRYLIENVQLEDVTGKPLKYMYSEAVDNVISYLINDMGQVYNFTIKINGLIIKFIDSYKLLPFSLAKLTKDFKIENIKVDYDIKNDCFITDENSTYIENDVIGLYQCIQKFREITGTHKNTIASAAYDIFAKKWSQKLGFKKGMPEKLNLWYDFKAKNFPTLSLAEDNFFRKAYKGAFCYVKDSIKGKVLDVKGDVFDVNSLYPYIMLSDRLIPVGRPYNYEPKELKNYVGFYEVDIKATLKNGSVPALFAKGFLGKSNKATYFHTINTYADKQTLVLTDCDIKLLNLCYNVAKIEYLQKYYFKAVPAVKIFGDYLEYFKKMKIDHAKDKDAYYTIAKLFQNSLYGKFGASYFFGTYKYNFDDESDTRCEIKKMPLTENDEPTEQTFVPIAAYITAHAREYIINLILKNPDNFLYCDTDSIHMIHKDKTGLPIDNAAYGYLKKEFTFKKCVYIRQKTYLEIGLDDTISIGFCGLNVDGQKELTNALKDGRLKMTDLTVGFEIKGKRQLKRVRGGYIIKETTFKIR